MDQLCQNLARTWPFIPRQISVAILFKLRCVLVDLLYEFHST